MIAGDGGFQMTQCELATLQQEKLDIKIAVVNNGYLGHGPAVAGVLLRQALRRHAACCRPDFVKLADAYGIAGAPRHQARGGGVRPCRRPARPAGAALIEFRVEKEEAVYPMVPAGADLHAMIRRPAAAAKGDRVKHTLVARVLDEPGVLNRRGQPLPRGAPSTSTASPSGTASSRSVSRMTIVVGHPAHAPAALVAENLRKLVPVLERRGRDHRAHRVARPRPRARARARPPSAREMADLVAIFRGQDRGRGAATP